MAKVSASLRPGLYPTPVVMVTCIAANGKPNIVTLAWVGVVCSEPPMIGIAVRPSRYSNPAIKAAGEFVVNIPSQDQLWATDYCGNNSGRDVDKFPGAKLTPVKADEVQPPLIGECPVNLECVVRHTLHLGTHDLFLGEVVAVHVEESCLDEQGVWDFAKMKPLSYCQGQYWNLGQMLGKGGLSKHG